MVRMCKFQSRTHRSLTYRVPRLLKEVFLHVRGVLQAVRRGSWGPRVVVNGLFPARNSRENEWQQTLEKSCRGKSINCAKDQSAVNFHPYDMFLCRCRSPMQSPSPLPVGSLTDISREFICNVTSYVRKIWPKVGKDGCALHYQEYITVRGMMTYYRVFVIYYLFLWQKYMP